MSNIGRRRRIRSLGAFFLCAVLLVSLFVLLFPSSADEGGAEAVAHGEEYSAILYDNSNGLYHLLPEHKFPEFLGDAAKAVKYVIDNVSKYGKSKGFIISGPNPASI